MFQKAVICTDLSPNSDSLVGCVGGLRALGVRSVVLTHVLDVFNDPRGDSIGTSLADEVFSRQFSALEASGLDVHVEAPMGHLGFSLEEVRRRHEAELIVLGSHGVHGDFLRDSRSASSDIMHVSGVPIFVASSSEQGQAGDAAPYEHMLRNILFCTDFSQISESAFETLLRLVDVGARDFTLLHVQAEARPRYTLGGVAFESDRSDAVRLGRLRERLVIAGAERVALEIIHGSPAEELAQRAASGEFTLIVMGSRGSSREMRPTVDGVCDRVVRSARTPLLMVPGSKVPAPVL